MVPLWLQLAYTLAVAGLLTIYWFRYGPANYLWFSDIALILTVPALWLESSLLASMMAVGVLLPELWWNISYFTRLLTGVRLTGICDYMFDERPAHLKALSLFHVPLPVLLLWLVGRLGYEPLALPAMTLLAWVVLPVTYLLTDPRRNINWVRGPGGEGVRQHWMHPLAYLGVLMAAFPLLLYLPTHFLLAALFG